MEEHSIEMAQGLIYIRSVNIFNGALPRVGSSGLTGNSGATGASGQTGITGGSGLTGTTGLL